MALLEPLNGLQASISACASDQASISACASVQASISACASDQASISTCASAQASISACVFMSQLPLTTTELLGTRGSAEELLHDRLSLIIALLQQSCDEMEQSIKPQNEL